MRFPWIGRNSHEEIVKLLTAELDTWKAEVSKLKAEREVLYDRLGAIGLGGPLFHIPVQEPEPEPEPDLVDPNELLNRIALLKGNPRRQRQEIQRQVKEAHRERNSPPSIARIPDVNAAMDAAEAAGRKQA